MAQTIAHSCTFMDTAYDCQSATACGASDGVSDVVSDECFSRDRLLFKDHEALIISI